MCRSEEIVSMSYGGMEMVTVMEMEVEMGWGWMAYQATPTNAIAQ